MALKGELTDLGIADLIQLHCQTGAQALLTVKDVPRQIDLYFADGEVVHAQGMGLEGEPAVYALFLWEQGQFEVTQGAAPAGHTIQLPWSALVLEGLRRKDEQVTPPPDTASAIAVPDPAGQAIHNLAAQTSFQGLVAVSRDGVVLAAALPQGMDVTRAGAVAAGLLSLSGRSVGQLGRGELQQTLIQGTQGNLIITQAGHRAVLLALSAPEMNLGLAFLEARESASALALVLDSQE